MPVADPGKGCPSEPPFLRQVDSTVHCSSGQNQPVLHTGCTLYRAERWRVHILLIPQPNEGIQEPGHVREPFLEAFSLPTSPQDCAHFALLTSRCSRWKTPTLPSLRPICPPKPRPPWQGVRLGLAASHLHGSQPVVGFLAPSHGA